VGDAAEDSTILATSGVKNTPKNSSLGGEGHIEKDSSTSADCRIPTASSTSHEGDSGEVWFSLADSTILTASEVKEFPSNLTVVIPEGVEGVPNKLLLLPLIAAFQQRLLLLMQKTWEKFVFHQQTLLFLPLQKSNNFQVRMRW
jgi:hypothetical protein